jgi:hypothetical protein
LVRTLCNQILDKVSTVLTVCITLLQTQHVHSLTHSHDMKGIPLSSCHATI